MSNFKKVLILIAILLVLLPLGTVSADAPPPFIDFEFQPQTSGAALTILSGTLYDCYQPDCQDAVPFQVTGGQQFCYITRCHALGDISPYHRLEIQFSDGKTRQSNVFQGASSTYTVYEVTIRPDDLLVETQSTSGYQSAPDFFKPLAIICGCLAGILVIVILLIIFLIRRSRKKK